MHFLVTPIGCGIAGYRAADIAPLFADCKDLDNVSLPASFWEIIDKIPSQTSDQDCSIEAEQLSVATPPPSFEGEGMSAPPPIPAVEDVSCTTPPPVPSELLEQAEYASQDMNGETEFDEEEDTHSSAQYEGEKKLSSGAIVGIILGVLVAIIFIIVMIVYIKNNYSDDYSHDSDLYSVIDSVAVDSVATYTYEEVDREREREQIAERRIYDRLQEYYTGLSEYPSPVNNILSKDFTNLLDRADEVALQYGDEMGFLCVSIWTDVQDNGKLTVLPFDSFTLDGDTAYVVATIEDSMYGNIYKRFEFVYEYGDWFVNDVTMDGSSLRSDAERFLADPDAWYNY
jgi:hypothetical protein